MECFVRERNAELSVKLRKMQMDLPVRCSEPMQFFSLNKWIIGSWNLNAKVTETEVKLDSLGVVNKWHRSSTWVVQRSLAVLHHSCNTIQGLIFVNFFILHTLQNYENTELTPKNSLCWVALSDMQTTAVKVLISLLLLY
jgi:hypothetical protein